MDEGLAADLACVLARRGRAVASRLLFKHKLQLVLFIKPQARFKAFASLADKAFELGQTACEQQFFGFLWRDLSPCNRVPKHEFASLITAFVAFEKDLHGLATARAGRFQSGRLGCSGLVAHDGHHVTCDLINVASELPGVSLTLLHLQKLVFLFARGLG